MASPVDSLNRSLALLQRLRGEDARSPGRVKELKRWQSQRLAGTYVDISSDPRFEAATRFFLEDLYGAHDFSRRDQAMLRIVPTMKRLLPAAALETAALAVELDALSEDLDHRLARALPDGPIDGASYGKAYRESSTRAERERQIELIDEVGKRLEALVRKPLVYRTLKLMRQPARLAGLADLQDFLERGFSAFHGMKDTRYFLALVRERETEILNRLFSGEPLPFCP